MEEHQIPQTLDAPPLALVFNASQLFTFIGFAIVGIVVNHPFIAGGVGLVAGSFLNKYVDKRPDGYLRHLAYFRGIPVMAGKSIPNGIDREFRP